MSISETFEELFRKRFGRAPTKEELTVLIDQSVKSYNQTGGITAHTVNVGPQPRRMTDRLKQQILTQVPRTNIIKVNVVMGDGEALQFAEEIYEFLRANQYQVFPGPDTVLYTVSTKGLTYDPWASLFIVGTNVP